ncbi:hypothetical protein CN692_23160 [Bacillus sp. AFS002410]|nr:hypothetical protein CN692_23160 [Bacillus sp. AFS002410]
MLYQLILCNQKELRGGKMKISKNETITSFQLFFFMVVAHLNIGIFTLPTILFKYAKHNGWISVLFSGVFSISIIFLYSLLLKRFPNLTIFEICKFFFGKWIGGILIVGYILYFIFTSLIISQFYIGSFGKWVFSNTPTWAILLLLMMIGIYLGKESIRTLTRFYQLAFWVIFTIFLFSLSAYKDVDWQYLLPIGNTNITGIVKGSYHSIFMSEGFVSLLVVYPFVKAHHRKKINSSIISALFVTFIYLFIVILCTGFFSSKELKLIPEPTIYLYKTLTFFHVLERLDLLFLSIWFVLIASSYVVYLFLANIGILNLLKINKNRTLSILVICSLIFLIGNFLPVTYSFMEKLLDIFNFASIIFIVVIPLLTLIISLLFKIKSKEVELT